MADLHVVTAALAVFALVVDVLGFALPYWYKYPGSWAGLWQQCRDYGYQSRCFSISGSLPAYFVATQAMETIGLIAAILGTVVILLTTFVNQFKAHGRMKLAAKVLCFFAAAFIALGVIIYGATRQHYLHAAYGLAVIGSILYFFVFLLLFCTRSTI